MENILNNINNMLKSNYKNINDFLLNYKDEIDQSNKLVMFVSSENEEVIKNIISYLKENNFKVLGNINCEEQDYESNEENDDNFDLELSFGGKYDFKVLPYGYDAISKLYFVYFYPLNENTLTYYQFHTLYFEGIVNIVKNLESNLSYLLIDDYGYVNNEEELILTIDLLDIKSLVNSVNILNKVISNEQELKELQGSINYINK